MKRTIAALLALWTLIGLCCLPAPAVTAKEATEEETLSDVFRQLPTVFFNRGDLLLFEEGEIPGLAFACAYTLQELTPVEITNEVVYDEWDRMWDEEYAAADFEAALARHFLPQVCDSVTRQLKDPWYVENYEYCYLAEKDRYVFHTGTSASGDGPLGSSIEYLGYQPLSGQRGQRYAIWSCIDYSAELEDPDWSLCGTPLQGMRLTVEYDGENVRFVSSEVTTLDEIPLQSLTSSASANCRTLSHLAKWVLGDLYRYGCRYTRPEELPISDAYRIIARQTEQYELVKVPDPFYPEWTVELYAFDADAFERTAYELFGYSAFTPEELRAYTDDYNHYDPERNCYLYNWPAIGGFDSYIEILGARALSESKWGDYYEVWAAEYFFDWESDEPVDEIVGYLRWIVYYNPGHDLPTVLLFQSAEDPSTLPIRLSAPCEGKRVRSGAITPDCTTEGYSGDLLCEDCGWVYETGKTLPMTDHTPVDGVCSVCGQPCDPPALPGDLTGDGILSIGDVSLLLAMLASDQPSAAQLAVADLNRDGILSINDVSRLLILLAT